MKFERQVNRELTDVYIPALFISNNMFGLDETSLKLYLYINFLVQSNMDLDIDKLAKKVGIKEYELKNSFDTLEEEELLLKTENGYIILDLKTSEINKTYIPKLKPKMDSVKSAVEKQRIAAASAINESFFQGIMALSWYVDISTLFEKYSFDEDVMIALFHECAERKALKKAYVFKVAESWYMGGVKTFEQLEDYQSKQDEINKIKSKIKSRLRLNRAFTEYEEKYIKSWLEEMKYSFDEVDYAIKISSSKGNASIGYINGILKNWKEKGLTTVAKIAENENVISKKDVLKKTKDASNLKHKNYNQRKGVDFSEYYDNI